MNIERRKSPRTQPEKLTYIHLQSDNGAIILNFSEDGLCFRSAGPILETGPVRFTFSLQPGQQPQAIGEVVWTDKARKKGGLRLTEFPADARNPLNVRLDRPPSQRIEKKRSDGTFASNEPASKVLTPGKAAASSNTSTPAKAAALLGVSKAVRVPQTVPSQSIVGIATKPKQSYRPSRVPSDAWRDWPTIKRGVVVGFAIFIIFAVVLVHAYADRLGQSIAHEQATRGSLSSAGQQSSVPASETAQYPSPLQELRAQIAALESESDHGSRAHSADARAGAKSDLAERNNFDPITDAAEDPATDSKADTSARSAQTDNDTAKAAISADAAPNSDAVSTRGADISEANADTASATYYDLGNFKDLARADKATNDLEKLGFRTIVVHKTMLWMSSFHVVVGPFSGDQDTETARSKLEILGFSPRVAKTH